LLFAVCRLLAILSSIVTPEGEIQGIRQVRNDKRVLGTAPSFTPFRNLLPSRGLRETITDTIGPPGFST
jgi:hypothetical protein